MTGKAESLLVPLRIDALEIGQFKPVKVSPAKSVQVAVPVPLTSEYFANLDLILVNMFTEGKENPVVLTPKGMRYVLDTLQDALSPEFLDEPAKDGSPLADELELIDEE